MTANTQPAYIERTDPSDPWCPPSAMGECFGHVVIDGIPSAFTRVMIKASLAYPERRTGVTTPPAFFEAVRGVLRRGTGRITIVELNEGAKSWPAERDFFDTPLVTPSHRPGPVGRARSGRS